MARKSHSAQSIQTASSGAFEVDKNLATVAGYATLAGGVCLSGAVGVWVAPVPVLGLTALGGGLVVAGNFEDLKERFSSDENASKAKPKAKAKAATKQAEPAAA